MITLYTPNTLKNVVLRLSTSNQHDLKVLVESFPDDVYDRSWLRLVADADEKVYGGGEQYSYFNLRGHSYEIWTREQGER